MVWSACSRDLSSVPVAETRQVVLVSAELLTLGLRLVLAEGLVDDRPNDIVVLHLPLKSVNYFNGLGTFQGVPDTFKI